MGIAMRLVGLVLAGVIGCVPFASILADEPPPGPEFTFPTVKAAPVEPPKPDPNAVPVLTPDTLYVVFSRGDGELLAFPKGKVKVVVHEGPVKISGVYFDSGGKRETRTFTGKKVYEVTGVEGQSGVVELLAVPKRWEKPTDLITRTVRVEAGTGPQPPPTPVDPPKPPTPAPIPKDGFRVMVVYERAELMKYPASQQTVLASAEFRGLLNDKCVVGPDGKTKEYRFLDKDAKFSEPGSVWEEALKRPRTALPWVVISDGKTGFEGPLPLTLDDAKALVKKYAP